VGRNFSIVYKILKVLDRWKGNEQFDVSLISAQAMKIDYPAWEQIMIELQRNGYIDGIVYSQTMSDSFPHIHEPICPRITLRGMEYLEENNLMKKAEEALKLVGEIV